jgi:hypothetical protein
MVKKRFYNDTYLYNFCNFFCIMNYIFSKKINYKDYWKWQDSGDYKMLEKQPDPKTFKFVF